MGKKIEKEESFKIFRQYKLEPIGEYTNSTTSVKCIDVNGYYVEIALDAV